MDKRVTVKQRTVSPCLSLWRKLYSIPKLFYHASFSIVKKCQLIEKLNHFEFVIPEHPDAPAPLLAELHVGRDLDDPAALDAQLDVDLQLGEAPVRRGGRGR